MNEEELSQLINSCVQCGNNISKRSLNHLSFSIQNYINSFPNVLISSIKSTICEFDSPIVPTRILISMSFDLKDLQSSYFLPIIHSIVKMAKSAQTSSVIAPIHNSVFLLPEMALSKEKANEIAMHIVDLLQQFIIQNEPFQVLATALSQFMKKWAKILPNPEIFISILLGILANTSLSYSTLSLTCQSITYLLIALVGLETSFKELLDDVINHKPTILDKCTSVSNICFLDFIEQTLPTAPKLQLIASVIFSLPDEKLSEIANKFTLLKKTIKQQPNDDIGRTCYFSMLSAVLKATSKQITPKALNMCCNALFSTQEINDALYRREIRYCFLRLLQCSSHIQNPEKFYEMLFLRILSLPNGSHLRQDALPLIIPYVPFSCITTSFFQEILSLLESSQNLALKCLSEIFQKFPLTQAYADLLFQKIFEMNQYTQTIILSTIVKSSKNAINSLRNLLNNYNYKGIEEEQKLTLLLLLASIESKSTLSLSPQLLRNAIHSNDFHVRLTALRLLCGQYRIEKEMFKILIESIPRVFVYFDIQYQNDLEKCLEIVITKLQPPECSLFLNELMKKMISILQPHQNEIQKSYILNSFKIIWRHKPLFYFSEKLLQQFILNLFENSSVIRDSIFKILIMIGKTVLTPENSSILSKMFEPNNKFINDLINKYKDSKYFKEADGAARLIALVYIMNNKYPIENAINDMWLEFQDDQDQIPSHFPLSVILHILQGSSKISISTKFLTNKVFPKLCNLIHESLDYVGITINPESIPIRSIKSEVLESQIHMNASKALLSIRQSFSIITCIINRFFESIPPYTVKEIGDVILDFLVESCNYSSVYYAHLTFQALCTRCFMVESCSTFPFQWSISLLQIAGDFTNSDHRLSGGFIQAALALIYSEPQNLFGSQRSIYHLMVQHCFSSLDNPCSMNDLRSALLLTESIANDEATKCNFEPYTSKLIMSVFLVYCQPMDFELRNKTNHCLTSLLKYYSHKIENKDFRYLVNTEFFQFVEGANDFFIEHLSNDQPYISYVILQILIAMKPFPNEVLFLKVSELCSCSLSRVRRSAARALLTVVIPEKAEEFVEKRICELSEKQNDTNTIDGIILQIQQLTRRYTTIGKNLLPKVSELCSNAIKNHITNYIQIYMLISLAREFDCLIILKPILAKLYEQKQRIVYLPLGYKLLRSSFYILEKNQIIQLLKSNDSALIFHYLLTIKKKPIKSKKIKSELLNLLLNDKSGVFFDIICPIVTKDFCPNEKQKCKYVSLLYETKEEHKLVNLLNIIPIFLSEPRVIFHRFSKYSSFSDNFDSNILITLSKLTLTFHEQIFSEHEKPNPIFWKIVLRIISDENPQIREPCCKALSYHFCYCDKQRIELCEYDLIKLIYHKLANYPHLLNVISKDFMKYEEEQSETHFLFPPSFHLKCIQKEIEPK